MDMKNIKRSKQCFASRINKAGYLFNAIMIFRAKRMAGSSSALILKAVGV